MTHTHRIKQTLRPRAADEAWCVILIRTGNAVFYGTKADCLAWLARNDGDENQ